jgi:hypothetical protein
VFKPPGTGSKTSIRVPPPGGLASRIVPSAAAARSAIPARPEPPRLAPPMPSSLIAMRSEPPRASIDTSTAVALACLAAFARASDTM